MSLDKLFEVVEQKQKQFWNPLILLQLLVGRDFWLLLEKKLVIRLGLMDAYLQFEPVFPMIKTRHLNKKVCIT